MFGIKKWTGALFDDATEEVTVYGTSFCQPALKRVLGPQVFTLENDTSGRYDHHAVSVLLAGQRVGFLPNEIAPVYFPIVIAGMNQKVWTVVNGEVGEVVDRGKWASLMLPSLHHVKSLAATLTAD